MSERLLQIKGTSTTLPDGRISRHRTHFLMVSILISLLILSMVNTPAEGEEVTLIQVGNETMESIELHFGPGGGIDPSLSIPISNEGPVISSRITISSVEDTAGPGRISIDVGMDGRDDWGFGGGEYGSLGSQSSFSNGHTIHRLLLDEETSSIEVLVPEDAIINDSWLSLSSPPVTEVENRILLRSLDEDIDVNAFDLCDIDGDSEDELIFFSISDSTMLQTLSQRLLW